MSYNRVLPRDLFNEAKLLKCLGQLALLLHDHEGRYRVELIHDDDEHQGFVIDQDDSSGNLSCRNLVLMRGDRRIIHLSSIYNSKAPYPLLYEIVRGDEEDSGDVFNDDGSFSSEFLQVIS